MKDLQTIIFKGVCLNKPTREWCLWVLLDENGCPAYVHRRGLRDYLVEHLDYRYIGFIVNDEFKECVK